MSDNNELDTRQSLSDLGALQDPNAVAFATANDGVSPAPLREQKIDAHGRAYATGKRKDAVARVWLKPGTGKVTVNGKTLEVYFARPVLRMILNQPLAMANRVAQYDVTLHVAGGGLSGQAGAVRHGLAKALTYYEPELRGPLKAEGFLTRDSRVVERKKYGRKKARRSFQFSKRCSFHAPAITPPERAAFLFVRFSSFASPAPRR